MKILVPFLAALQLAAMSSCASSPSLVTVDSALLAEAPTENRAAVNQARVRRDAADDAHAVAQNQTKKAEAQVEVARASLKTVRSQLDETKLAIEIIEDSGSPTELEQAESVHAYALAKADYARELLAHRKREFELAKLRERLALEEYRLSLAAVELEKARAVQGVDLVAAQQIPIQDYRKQMAYHIDETETARARVTTAEERLLEAANELAAQEERMRSLEPSDEPAPATPPSS